MCSNVIVCAHKYIYVAFGSAVVITAMILWFAFDMIKYGALHSESDRVLDAIVSASRIEPNEKCITHKNENVTTTHLFGKMACAYKWAPRITMLFDAFEPVHDLFNRHRRQST